MHPAPKLAGQAGLLPGLPARLLKEMPHREAGQGLGETVSANPPCAARTLIPPCDIFRARTPVCRISSNFRRFRLECLDHIGARIATPKCFATPLREASASVFYPYYAGHFERRLRSDSRGRLFDEPRAPARRRAGLSLSRRREPTRRGACFNDTTPNRGYP